MASNSNLKLLSNQNGEGIDWQLERLQKLQSIGFPTLQRILDGEMCRHRKLQGPGRKSGTGGNRNCDLGHRKLHREGSDFDGSRGKDEGAQKGHWNIPEGCGGCCEAESRIKVRSG